MKELLDTNSAAIAAEFVSNRSRAGSPAMGMVLTLIVVSPADAADDAMAAARLASREHPARVLGVILGDGRGRGRVDAQVGIGQGWGGETALISLHGEVTKHPASVVRPLLLPDSPVACWWPVDPPEDPALDPIGQLAGRRITDAAAATRRRTTALLRSCRSYRPGNTDLAWTRLTPWRAQLAAALDDGARVRAGSVTAERGNPSADLLAAWLRSRLQVPITQVDDAGPGITDVSLETAAGAIRIRRGDGRLAMVSSPGQPDRPVALKRREVPELLAEELRRLDEDEIYAETVEALVRHA